MTWRAFSAQSLKAAVAAGLAWVLVLPLGGVADAYPYYAPLGAVIAVSSTVAGSLRSSLQAVVSIAIGAAIAVGVVALASEDLRIDWTGEVIFAMAWLVLVLSIGATTLLYLMIRPGEVSRIAGLFYLVPAVTAALAWALFGGTLSAVQILGMAVCTGAVMLVTRRA